MAEPARPLPTTSYQFGPYVVEIVSGELRKHGVRLKLQDRPFNLLVALLERSGEVVTREELRQRLWPDGTFVDFDHNISSCINKLRSALNDSPRNPRFIETVGRRGYRFVGVCAPGPPDREFLPDQAPQPATASSLPLRRLAFGVAAVLLIACSAVAGYLAYGKLHPQSPKVRRMMAVLPFKNLTGDETQDYFSDGLTEEMITQLGKLNPQRLGVIGRTSVMHYKESQERLDTIGRELGVDYVLEGSVRRGAGRVRVTAQLIQVSDQTHIWAKDYDQQETDFIRMEDQISDEIADEIQTSLAIPSSASPDASRGTQDYEAYDLYLKGRYFLSKRNPQGLRQAVEYFGEAISKDSNYARAYAGLADSYSLLSSYGFEPASQGVPKARSAALRALAIDDNLAEAHTSLAWIEEQYDHDWQSAEREYHRAIELDPNYATAHQWYGELLGFQGRFDEAITEMEHAKRLDPLSLIIGTDYGTLLYLTRDYDRSIQEFKTVLEIDPSFPRAYMLMNSYAQKGQYDLAWEVCQKSRQFLDTQWALASIAFIRARSGHEREARKALARLKNLSKSKPVEAGALAEAYLGLGDKESALNWLEKGYEQHSTSLSLLKVDPLYDPLRSDPRFQKLLQKMGLDQ